VSKCRKKDADLLQLEVNGTLLTIHCEISDAFPNIFNRFTAIFTRGRLFVRQSIYNVLFLAAISDSTFQNAVKVCDT
jgi:hypothetical protein